MEITVRREDLVRDLQVIQGIVDRRGAIAILSNALLVASNDSLALSATDLDVSVKASCPARVKKGGATTLPARKLHDIVKALPSGSDILLRDDEEGFVTVQSERTNYKVAALPKDDFPTLPESKGAQVVYFESNENSLTPEQKSLLQDLALICEFKATSDLPQWMTRDEYEHLRAYLNLNPEIKQTGRYTFEIGNRQVDFTPATELPKIPNGLVALWASFLSWLGDFHFVLRIFKWLDDEALRKRRASL